MRLKVFPCVSMCRVDNIEFLVNYAVKKEDFS